MWAYIIKDKKIICSVKTELKNGTIVEFGGLQNISDMGHLYLCNARTGKISRNKKYDKEYQKFGRYWEMFKVTEILPKKFLIEDVEEE